jgi:hypothetical protein
MVTNMKYKAVQAITLLVLLAVLIGCRPLLPVRVKQWILQDQSHEAYRVEAAVCSTIQDVTEGRGVLLGLRFTLTKLEDSCEEGGRQAFVSVGRPDVMRQARRLRVHQHIVAVGTLDGQDRQTLIVKQLKLR